MLAFVRILYDIYMANGVLNSYNTEIYSGTERGISVPV